MARFGIEARHLRPFKSAADRSAGFQPWDERASRIDERISERHFREGSVSVSSAHPMGGCRMGASVADSVTDSWGTMHGRISFSSTWTSGRNNR